MICSYFIFLTICHEKGRGATDLICHPSFVPIFVSFYFSILNNSTSKINVEKGLMLFISFAP